MKSYSVLKGVGKTAEFKGLTAQFLSMFFIGLFSAFIFYVILNLMGVGMGVNLVVCGVSLVAFSRMVFVFNKKYGRYGLMKLQASRSIPKVIINRLRFTTMLTKKQHGKK